MSIKLLIDMNLSPDWVPVLKIHGWSAVHWSAVGDPRASDDAIMNWAVMNEYVVVTWSSLLLSNTLATWLPGLW